MGAAGVYSAVIHYNDLVGVHHRADALGNNDFCGIGDFLTEGLADQGISLGIHGTGAVVQNKDLRLAQDRTGNAQALLLPAGNIGTALLDIGIIPIGEGADKVIGLRQTTGVYQLLVGRIGVAPAQVLLYRPAEQGILLQYHRHIVPQCLQVIVPHIHAAYLYTAASHIVQTGDELH